jgi:hypothetical protein
VMDEAWQAQQASQISKLMTTRLLWMEMDERNDLQHEVWNMRHTALSHFGHDTPCQEQSALRSQPNSKIRCSWGQDSWKPAWSTDLRKLKVISWSQNLDFMYTR